jgi:hypothetical protein
VVPEASSLGRSIGKKDRLNELIDLAKSGTFNLIVGPVHGNKRPPAEVTCHGAAGIGDARCRSRVR